jgi:hypothetical protein
MLPVLSRSLKVRLSTTYQQGIADGRRSRKVAGQPAYLTPVHDACSERGGAGVTWSPSGVSAAVRAGGERGSSV